MFDCWFHDQDIREALGRPGFLEGEVADLSLARIPPKGLGYIVGKKAGAPAGTTVVFVIEGTPAIIAAISVPPEGRAVLLDDAPDAPTVTHHDRPPHVRPARRRALERRARARRTGSCASRATPTSAIAIVDNMAFTTMMPKNFIDAGWMHDES